MVGCEGALPASRPLTRCWVDEGVPLVVDEDEVKDVLDVRGRLDRRGPEAGASSDEERLEADERAGEGGETLEAEAVVVGLAASSGGGGVTIVSSGRSSSAVPTRGLENSEGGGGRLRRSLITGVGCPDVSDEGASGLSGSRSTSSTASSMSDGGGVDCGVDRAEEDREEEVPSMVLKRDA